MDGTWTFKDCGGDSDYDIDDYVEWNATPLTRILIDSSDSRQRKSVLILGVSRTTGDSYVGSGVMVDDDTVLTAAHVIAGSAGYTDLFNLRVCSLGNVETGAQCKSATALVTPGGTYDGTTADDYGLLTITSPWSASIDWMAISAAQDSILASVTHVHDGFPSYQTSCLGNGTTHGIVEGSYMGYNWATLQYQFYTYYGYRLHTATGPAKTILASTVRFNVASAGGMSGGPYYYCPSPSGCTGTQGGFITAVTHGHSASPPFTSGAKGSAIRDWVIANL